MANEKIQKITQATKDKLPAIGNTVATVIAGAGVLAVAATGIKHSESAKKYDNDTEASLKTIIKPSMQSDAGKLMDYKEAHPSQVVLTKRKDGKIEASLNASDNVLEREIDIVMEAVPGTSRPDQTKVDSVDVHDDDPVMTKSGVPSLDNEVTLSAPGQNPSYSSNEHPDGWSARRIGGIEAPYDTNIDSSLAVSLVSSDELPAPGPEQMAADNAAFSETLVDKVLATAAHQAETQ